jgi:hypothetical protein
MAGVDVRVLDDKVNGRPDIEIAVDGIEIVDEVRVGWQCQALIW